MAKVFEGTENEYYMDGFMKKNLDVAKKVIKKDWDMVFLYDGNEGSGKSVKAMQDAYYCDPSLTVDRIVFNPEDFKKAVMSAEKYQAIIYDEAYGGLSSRSAMGSVNKAIVQMLTVIREKNLFIFIVLPSFFDIDKYVALWRSRALIHIYTAENFERGYFAFYNKDRKKKMYVEGKKYYNYKVAKPNFFGRFTNFYPVDEKEYREKKSRTSITIGKAEEKESKRFGIALHLLCKEHSQREVAMMLRDCGLEITQPRINQLIRESVVKLKDLPL